MGHFVLKQTLATVPTVLPGRAREDTTMWSLLVWAFKRELVRHCTERVSRDDWGSGGGSNAATICRMLETGIAGSGPVARVQRVPVHPDAEWVYGIVKTLDRDEFWLIVNTSENAVPPTWDPEIELARVVPVLKANGRPRMIVCPIERRPVACRIEIVGIPHDEANRMRADARETYARWYRLLWAIREKIVEEGSLTRWNVTGIGAEPHPWGAG